MTKVARLVEQFSPKHYDVTFTVDADNRSFTGAVSVQGSVNESRDSISLHANGLNITSAQINGSEATFSEQNKHHEVHFSTGDTLTAGEHVISVAFSGEITDAMQGIYPSTFTLDGKEKAIIATQFESNHAREAFPCIDEPAAKATFQLTLVSKSGEVALSNTPIESQEESEQVTTVFEPTPKMSTYLLSFATGDMHSVERVSKNGIAIKAWSSKAQPKTFLDYPADEAVSILDFFEEYFGVPYPLKKCDLIALPDFDAGAMENWGMITFREIAMLADPDNRSISNEQFVSMVVAHEVSHMWFGNLVTMQWWDDLWLNESFASLMEHVALDSVHPDWNQWEHYAASDILSTTSRDIHKDIQPISMEVEDPELIETLFDPGIVYTKGGRLLKMLMEYIGTDAFRAGLKDYFEKHAYGNTTREDLWESLGAASGEDIDSLMGQWLDQPGMPVVSITQDAHNLTLKQERFTIGADSNSPQTWPIPHLSNVEFEPSILTEKSTDIQLENDASVLLNTSASGHFISHYTTPEHRSHVREMLVSQEIASHARINTLNDIVLLSRKGTLPFSEALNAISGLGNEPRFPVWAQVARIIGTAQQLTEDDEVSRTHLRTLRSELAQKHFSDLGLTDKDGEDPNTTQLRSMMLSFMLGAQNEEALAYAQAQLDSANSPENLPAESRAALLGSLIKQGNTELIDALVAEYATASSDMQLDTISAISSTKDPKKANELLELAIGVDGFAKPQDMLRVLAIFMRNHYIRDATWDYMVDNWDRLVAVLSTSKSFDYLPTYCAAVVSDEAMAKRYRDLFEPYMEHKTLRRNIAIGLVDIEARVAWRQRNQEPVAEWLKNYAKDLA